MMIEDQLIIVRGGGDIATGAIQKLHNCGFKVLILESKTPTSIRKKVCFGEAIYQGEVTVEGSTARRIESISEVNQAFEDGVLPVLADPLGMAIDQMHPSVVIDGILAKENLGTNRDMAPVTIALGPGFSAGKDVDVVVETNRGHRLGSIIWEGEAEPDTGTPGIISGFGKERVIYSPFSGKIKNLKRIGDLVKKDEVIAEVAGQKVTATISGVLRGIIGEGHQVHINLKIADIDPRLTEQKNCFTISDKARCIGGAVLEAVIMLLNQRNDKLGRGKDGRDHFEEIAR